MALPGWKAHSISDENSSKTICFRAAHTYIRLVHIETTLPPSPTPWNYLIDLTPHSLCLVEPHRSSLSTNLDRVLEFWMDQLSHKIMFAGLAQKYHVSFAVTGRQSIHFGRRIAGSLLDKQWPWLWGKLRQDHIDQGIGKCKSKIYPLSWWDSFWIIQPPKLHS